jgi:predicted nucleotidyltransferase
MSTFDEILSIASQDLPEAGIDCLLIGGLAVNHYGFTRNTLDVDFMIAGQQVDPLKTLLRKKGFTNISIHENVVFFTSDQGGPRIDFLQVDPETMAALLARAVPMQVGGYPLKAPSLTDLLAMKIFALVGNPARRMAKDLPDIAYLTLLNDLSLERDILPLCERYGSPDIFRMIQSQIEELNR